MKTKPLPYLCGGIFLVLLTEAKGKAASRRQLRSGKKDRVSNRNMLEALIQMVVPSFQQPLAGRTFEGDTSDYRACKVAYGENLPFDDDVEIQAFDKRVKTQYITVLKEMDEFVDSFLRTDSDERMKWLIQSLLILMEEDKLITPETPFFIASAPVLKSDLLALDHYCLSPLLLGIWHFIVMNRPDNETGRRTFEALHDRADEMHAKWVFKSSFGSSYPREFDFDLFGTTDAGGEAEECTEETKKAPADEAEAEVIDAEVVEDGSGQEQRKTEQTLNNNGRIYHQQAQTIYNIEHIDVFNG